MFIPSDHRYGIKRPDTEIIYGVKPCIKCTDFEIIVPYITKYEDIILMPVHIGIVPDFCLSHISILLKYRNQFLICLIKFRKPITREKGYFLHVVKIKFKLMAKIAKLLSLASINTKPPHDDIYTCSGSGHYQ